MRFIRELMASPVIGSFAHTFFSFAFKAIKQVPLSLDNLKASAPGTSLVAQMVKNLPAMLETWVQSLGWEDPPEEEMVTHSSILAWRIPMDREAWRATVHEVTKSWTQLSD